MPALRKIIQIVHFGLKCDYKQLHFDAAAADSALNLH